MTDTEVDLHHQLAEVEATARARKRAMTAACVLLEDALHAHHNGREQVVEDHIRQAIGLLDV